MSTEKAKLTERIQKYVSKSDWKSAIPEMEKLFAVDNDPKIRVRIGDAFQKLNKKPEAVKEYIRAADLYAREGFVVKALAQFKLALRLDPANKHAQEKIEALHSHQMVQEKRFEPVASGTQEPVSSVIPLFSDFTQEEFNEFTKRMVIHNVPAGRAIIREGEAGSSVYVITHGSVKVYTTVQDTQVELAVLQPSDFFGEIAFITGKPRTATVEALEDTDLLEVPEEELLDLISQKPRIREVMQNYYEQRVQSTLAKVREKI